MVARFTLDKQPNARIQVVIGGGMPPVLNPRLPPMARNLSSSLRVRFGKRVREIRERRKLSLEALGERAGMSDKFIQAIETARQSPTIDSVEKLALGLDTNLAELFSFGDERPPQLRRRAVGLVKSAGEKDLARVVPLLESALY